MAFVILVSKHLKMFNLNIDWHYME